MNRTESLRQRVLTALNVESLDDETVRLLEDMSDYLEDIEDYGGAE